MNNKIKVKITGKNPNYFLKEIIKNKINIYSLYKKDNYINISINYKDLEIINNIKTNCNIKIIERFGLNKIEYFIKKYSLLLIFTILGVILNVVLSNMIFEIEVIHSNNELVKIVENDLKDLGIKKYHFKVSNKEKELIKEKILLKENKLLEWIEIEEKGTKYIIRVEQRKINKMEKICNARSIVSKKNALIMEIKASSGEIVKKKNDYIEKGEVVISGLIYNKEKIVSKKCAKGTIYGEVWYKVKVSIPKKYKKLEKTNKVKRGISVNILDKSYNLFNPYQLYEKNEYNIVESKIIPLNIGICKYNELIEINKKYTNKDINSIAIDLATKKIKNKLKKDEVIISKKVLKKNEFNSKIEVEVFFKIKENITDYLDISKPNIEKMNKKEE